ncbi:MAG TPA: anhydro-N-acetylmuramic acid kinase [Puia sp.]|uniref:anhydro-N-acetylmuramic acid kinase n=1 Tax=Puia sp. TaxID=2045100 RepID=UPI002BAA3BA7|nr:anhydro-N-acetylmuramic acid kinase [Puia sp.]HVU95375.1 anhydro-N-acetylmuramic acid kinase [Puia sp.]
MVYKIIGLMSGSSLDGLDIAYVELQEQPSTQRQGPRAWGYTFLQTATDPYPEEWRRRLTRATGLSALEYQLLHVEYGRYLGERVLAFIEAHGLHYQVQLIASHGHTTFHDPARRMTAQLGDGAAIAAVTGVNVVSDLRAMDVALGGQGAPIVPIGERLLLPGNEYFLNLGGIANISRGAIAYDVCPANRVLNALAELEGKAYDAGGELAAAGRVDERLLERLNALDYYGLPYPKSLANEFGTETVLPMVLQAELPTADALRTYVEHIMVQVGRAVEQLGGGGKTLVTGGGAHNAFLVERLRAFGIDVVVPEAQLVDYKEALVMALMGVLRWREENNVLASVTGASRDSIGGAVWIGQEA